MVYYFMRDRSDDKWCEGRRVLTTAGVAAKALAHRKFFIRLVTRLALLH